MTRGADTTELQVAPRPRRSARRVGASGIDAGWLAITSSSRCYSCAALRPPGPPGMHVSRPCELLGTVKRMRGWGRRPQGAYFAFEGALRVPRARFISELKLGVSCKCWTVGE